MKQAAIVVVALGISMASFAQNNTKPANGQAAQPAGQAAAAAPQGKRPPQAKTQPEFEAYKAAVALTDAAALEKAADDFATKFPDSELRGFLYKQDMRLYQQANNGAKMLDAAHKVLSYDPDDPEALVGAAQVLADRTRDTDLDKDQKLAEAKKDAERALVTVDTDVQTGNATPEQINAVKGYLRSEAYEVLGTIDYNNKAWPESEANLRKSIDALKYADQAVQMTKEETVVGKAARSEKDRLTQLNSGSAPGQPSAQTPAAPK